MSHMVEIELHPLQTSNEVNDLKVITNPGATVTSCFVSCGSSTIQQHGHKGQITDADLIVMISNYDINIGSFQQSVHTLHLNKHMNKYIINNKLLLSPFPTLLPMNFKISLFSQYT